MQQSSTSSLKPEETSSDVNQKDQQTPATAETESRRSTVPTIASTDLSEEDPKLIAEYKHASNLCNISYNQPLSLAESLICNCNSLQYYRISMEAGIITWLY